MNTNHTPGPWTCNVVIDGRADFSAEKIQPQYVINRSGAGSPIIPRPEAAANARLIAAAPDLLKALKVLAQACVRADSIEELSEYVDGSFIDAARAAIAKAEGAA